MALPKAYRLRRRQDFARTYRRGRRFSTPHLRLSALRLSAESLTDSGQRVQAEPHHLLSRIAVVVSQKVSKRAVVRNQLRRQIQTILLELLPEISDQWLIIISVKPGAVDCEANQFLQELRQLFVDAEVVHGSS